MVEQSNGQSKAETPSEDYRRGRRGTFVIALVAVALLAGLTGNLLSKAFGQGEGWHHIAWHDGGMFGGPLSPAQIDHVTGTIQRFYMAAQAPSQQSA